MDVIEAVRVPLPTPYGTFEVRAFERPSGHVYVAMIHGDLGDGNDVLVRVHSECLTGDALHSLRCDCGIQLQQALRIIASDRCGVLIYATGHEGRGIGLVNKLRAYVAQDQGADTVDANLALGLAVDARDYTDAAAVIEALGVRTVRLLTNNPKKISGLRRAGTVIDAVVPLATSPHARNIGYVRTKAQRLGHLFPNDDATLAPAPANAGDVDVMSVLGPVRPRKDRPFVVVKYAQSIDGRIATATGDSRWISGEQERTLSHALRAACDAVMVGVGTVIRDEPQLTVRMVSGASPKRVVLDSTLRLPAEARILDDAAPTTVVTTERSDPQLRERLRALGVCVEVVGSTGDGRVDLHAALARLRCDGVQSVLVEGGAALITSMFAAGVVDRLVIATAPIVLGSGTEAVQSLGIETVAEAIQLTNRSVHLLGDDVVIASDVVTHGDRCSDAAHLDS
jgi:GTP cyclohydrolase II